MTVVKFRNERTGEVMHATMEREVKATAEVNAFAGLRRHLTFALRRPFYPREWTIVQWDESMPPPPPTKTQYLRRTRRM